jgi:hypothetical protein
MKRYYLTIYFCFLLVSCILGQGTKKSSLGKDEFKKKVKKILFSCRTDSPDTLISSNLKLNYDKEKIEIRIDSISLRKKKILEKNLNNLVFKKDSLAIKFFENPDKLNHFLILELSKNMCQDYITKLYYIYDPGSYSYVGNLFLSEENGFRVEEPTVDEIYKYRRDWIKKYFPKIITSYKLSLSDYAILASYLYLEGEKKYLNDLLSEKNKSIEERDAIIKIANRFGINI